MRMRARLGRWCAIGALGVSIACGREEPASGGRPQAAEAAVSSDWTANVEPMSLPASGTSAQPQLTRSDRGVILSWLEHTDSGATLRFSERRDRQWSPARTIASDDDWFVSWADVPAVLRMSDGTLVATWHPAIDPLLEAYELRLSYSRDDGKTWATPFTPHHDGTKTQHGFASLFELPDKTLGLVWLDGREQELKAAEREGGSMALYFARFDRSWKQTAETAVNTRVCECCPTAAVATDDGVVTAFRDRSPREIRDINVSRLENGAWTPERPLHVDGWEIDACPVNGPALSARGRQVAAAWFTAPGDKGQALAAFSSDAGRTWSDPIRLDEKAARGHVDIEMLDDGSAIATWVELGEGGSRFRMRRVEPSGARSRAIDINASAGGVTGYPRVTRFGNELVFAWTETGAGGEGGEQIRGAVATVQGR